MEERLRKFAYLVDSGSFTKAARELHVSQPALSSAIAKLESELHTPLLIRGGRQLQLTSAGVVAYESAKELAVHGANLHSRLARLSHERLPLSLGMIDSVASALFSAGNALGDLEQQASLSIVVNNSRYLMQATEQDKLDVAFVAEQPDKTSSLLDSSYVASEPMVVVCHSDDKAAVARSVASGKLSRFIGYDQPSNSYRLIQEALRHQGLEPEGNIFSTSPTLMLRLVLLKKGVAALPYLLVRERVARGQLALVGQPQAILIERRVVRVVRRGKALQTPLEDVTEQIRQLLRQHYAEAKNHSTTSV